MGIVVGEGGTGGRGGGVGEGDRGRNGGKNVAKGRQKWNALELSESYTKRCS